MIQAGKTPDSIRRRSEGDPSFRGSELCDGPIRLRWIFQFPYQRGRRAERAGMAGAVGDLKLNRH